MKAKSYQRPLLPTTDVTKVCLDNFEQNFFAISLSSKIWFFGIREF
jgi:hypothetical protein